MRHVHAIEPLFIRPPADDIADRANYYLASFDRYVKCRTCGKVGLYSNHASGRLRWNWSPEWVDQQIQRAARWNAKYAGVPA